MNKNIVYLCLVVTFTAYGQEPSLVEYESLQTRAESAFRQENSGEIISTYQALTELNPRDSLNWTRLAQGYELNGDIEAALSAASRAYEIGSVNPSALAYRLARLSALAGHEDEALVWLETALNKRFDDRPRIFDEPAFAELRADPEFIALSAHPENPESINRLQGLEIDLDYLLEEAQRMHASPAREAYSDKYLDAVASLRGSLGEISDQQFYLGVMKLLALLNDGDTAIYTPDEDSPLEIQLASLPLKFYWFDEGLFIVDGVDGNDGYAGYEVLQFGSLTSDEVLQRLREFRGTDNAMTWRWMGPQFYLSRLELLNAIGATESPSSVLLTLRNAEGEVSQVQFQGGDYVIPRKLRPSPAMTQAVPPYLENVDSNFWMQSLADEQTLYVQFNQVRNMEGLSLEEFSAQLASRLDQDNVRNLVVDVRHNNGGNNSLIRPLVQTLISFDQDADNKIFVITGRNTFSAAQNFINQVERWTDAVFVGEPSASSPNFTGEETNLLLPYSRIHGSISTKYWQDSNPGDSRAWIAPDIPVSVTAADYFSGIDAALETVYQLIAE